LQNAERKYNPGPATLEFVLDVVPDSDVEIVPAKKLDPAQQALAKAREKLTSYLPRAVEILTELAETSENDRVRLAAAESIADRAGLGKTSVQRVEVDHTEHEIAEREAQELLSGIKANAEHATQHKDVSLEALIVHEGEDSPPTVST
jgi:hypothetical protein